MNCLTKLNHINMKCPPKYKKYALLFIIFAPILIALYTWVVMLLWNEIMPDLIGAAKLDFWHAMGLILLAKLIFGFGGRSCRNKSHKKDWKHKLKHKMSTMSPEERAEFKSKMKDCMPWKDIKEESPDAETSKE